MIVPPDDCLSQQGLRQPLNRAGIRFVRPFAPPLSTAELLTISAISRITAGKMAVSSARFDIAYKITRHTVRYAL
jgi:hypothetical protein